MHTQCIRMLKGSVCSYDLHWSNFHLRINSFSYKPSAVKFNRINLAGYIEKKLSSVFGGVIIKTLEDRTTVICVYIKKRTFWKDWGAHISILLTGLTRSSKQTLTTTSLPFLHTQECTFPPQIPSLPFLHGFHPFMSTQHFLSSYLSSQTCNI